MSVCFLSTPVSTVHSVSLFRPMPCAAQCWKLYYDVFGLSEVSWVEGEVRQGHTCENLSNICHVDLTIGRPVISVISGLTSSVVAPVRSYQTTDRSYPTTDRALTGNNNSQPNWGNTGKAKTHPCLIKPLTYCTAPSEGKFTGKQPRWGKQLLENDYLA